MEEVVEVQVIPEAEPSDLALARFEHAGGAWRTPASERPGTNPDSCRARPRFAWPASDSSKVGTLRLLLDLVAQKRHAVFDRGRLDELQVLPILENARPLPRVTQGDQHPDKARPDRSERAAITHRPGLSTRPGGYGRGERVSRHPNR